MLDVLIAGAGPAGSVAALVLARAGVRVLVVDRETFPRDKLCGDTVNPGAVALLSMLGLKGGPLGEARPLAGMLMTGPRVTVAARYPAGVVGLALLRRHLDAWLLDEAIRAGARFESGLIVRGPLMADTHGVRMVRGAVLTKRGGTGPTVRMPATMTIAADGRRSTLARALDLCEHPPRRRRWAFGTYASGIAGVGELGEMHVRPGGYIGIAPLPGGMCNVCVVTGPRPDGRTPQAIVSRAINREPMLADRFASARFEDRVSVLGPLAVEARAAGTAGLLLAGDAAGFVDPMTGDGLHLAMRGAVLAANEVIRVLTHGDFVGAVDRLDLARRTSLGPKIRFNRAVRRLVASPAAVHLAQWGAAVAPAALRQLVRYAGDAA
jgi:flavin-dependent dehydrogenase